MNNPSNAVWNKDSTAVFAAVLTDITNEDNMRQFLRDVMTEKEINEISARLKAATMLNEGKKYSQIVEETNLSTRTVARISEWLKNGTGGYRQVLNDTAHHSHLPPARA